MPDLIDFGAVVVPEASHAEGGDAGNPPYTPKWLLGAALPGHGEVGEADGDYSTWKCGPCGRVFKVHKRCMRRECPKCYQAWAYDQGGESAMRFWQGVRKIAKLNALRHYRLLHGTVSFIEDGSSLATYRAEAVRVAKKQGFSGGCKVFHAFRKDKVMKRYLLDGTVHFHVIGVAFGDVRIFEHTGEYVWKVIKNMRTPERPYGGIGSMAEVKMLIGYQLTHCGLVGDCHAVTWWGCLKDRRVAKKVLVLECSEGWAALHERGNPKCPKCGSKDTFECLEDGSVDPSAAARKLGMSRWRTGNPSWASNDGAVSRAALCLSVEEVERLDQLRRERIAEMASYG